MISKKKIVAIVLFILMGFIMFTFANPSDGIDSLTDPIEDKPVVPVKEPEKEVIVNPVVVVDNAPVITVEPAIVKIVEGTEYNVLTGVTATDDKDTNLVINASITSVEEVGEYDVTYTVTDSANHTVTATRKIFVLAKDGDEDEDHYTNEEELVAETDFDDEESIPDYDYAPSIKVDGDLTSVVYDKLSDIKESCSDNYYTETYKDKDGVTCEVDTTKVDFKNIGTYTVTITATDILGNVTTKEVDYIVTARNINVVIDDKTSVYGNELESLTYKTSEELASYPAGIVLVKATGLDADTYAITGDWTNKNYNVTFTNGEYEITKKEVSPTFGTVDFTYTGEVQRPTARVKDINGNDIEIVVDVNGNAIDAGTYTATVNFKEQQKNYKLVNNSIDYVINEALLNDYLNPKFNDKTVDYDGKNHVIEATEFEKYATVKYYNVETDEEFTGATEAGVYNLKAVFTPNGNYIGSMYSIATLTIKPKTINAVWEEVDYTYNVSNQIPSVSAKDINGNEIELHVSVNGEAIDAGTYIATAEFRTAQNNYKLANTTYEYVIKKAPFGTATDLNFNDSTVEYDNKNHMITATNFENYKHLLTVKYYNVATGKEFTGAKEVGVYNLKAVFTAKEDTNYTGSFELTATLTITAPKAVQTGIMVEVKPNVQLEFKKGANVNIKDYINVYETYSDGSKKSISNYEVKGFDTAKVTKNSTLIIKSGKYTDNSLTYSIISEEAFQTKFEVLFTGKNEYEETKKDSCTKDCDKKSKTRTVSTEKNVLEIIEHYSETIEVKNVVAHYSTESSILKLTDSVRWSRQDIGFSDSVKYNPVYIASRKSIVKEDYEVEVCDGLDLGLVCIGNKRTETRTRDKEITVDVMNSGNKIKTVDITYTREFSRNVKKTYTITFEYANGVFKAIDEIEI